MQTNSWRTENSRNNRKNCKLEFSWKSWVSCVLEECNFRRLFCLRRKRIWVRCYILIVWLLFVRTILVKFASYLFLVVLKHTLTFFSEIFDNCSINKAVVLPFWKGQMRYFLGCWLNLQRKERWKKYSGGIWNAEPETLCQHCCKSRLKLGKEA